ncbi:hypothetical protein BpHYR1_033623 [Brachionus plicatilis]|uniref:Uncharacterized protein n=1 Tax=Brachionus plicatilis TaxID=10195 RepID=A0A3M7SYG2_BRAPC|nr:hypothetical protein BpHYR1_033623 [Brachionus plicatilis]
MGGFASKLQYLYSPKPSRSKSMYLRASTSPYNSWTNFLLSFTSLAKTRPDGAAISLTKSGKHSASTIVSPYCWIYSAGFALTIPKYLNCL